MMYNVNLKSFDFKQIENQVEELFKSAPNQDSFNEQFNAAFPEANCVKLPTNLAKASSASLLKKFDKLTDAQLHDVFAKIIYLIENDEAAHLYARLQKYLDKLVTEEDAIAQDAMFVDEEDCPPTQDAMFVEEKLCVNLCNTKMNGHAVDDVMKAYHIGESTEYQFAEANENLTFWQRVCSWFHNFFN